MRPNFLYIGPDKSGSTWLHNLLLNHPRCFVPQFKDIYFFDRYYHKGWEWYESHFKSALSDSLAIGELSHDYLFSTEAADRIAHDLPNIKLLTILRDPVERAFSHYLYLVSSGYTKLPFEEALEEIPRIFTNGLYGQHLLLYYDHFESNQMSVFDFQKLHQTPEILAHEILTALGLEMINTLPVRSIVLPAARARIPLAAKWIKITANWVRGKGHPGIVGFFKSMPIIRKALYVPYDRSNRPKMSEDIKKQLRDKYAEDRQQLESLVGLRFNWGE